MDIHSRMMMGLGRALEATVAKGKRAFGWVRLGRIRSFEQGNARTYVIAIRKDEKNGFQLGCSCPHWLHRQRFANDGRGALCKHQARFLTNEKKVNNPNKGIWLYKAGKAFLGSWCE